MAYFIILCCNNNVRLPSPKKSQLWSESGTNVKRIDLFPIGTLSFRATECTMYFLANFDVNQKISKNSLFKNFN